MASEVDDKEEGILPKEIVEEAKELLSESDSSYTSLEDLEKE